MLRIVPKLAKAVREVGRVVKCSCMLDRNVYLNNLAIQADRAMLHGDSSTAYSIVRKLSGKRAMQARVLQKLDGSLTTSAIEVAQVWQDHYATVYQGHVFSSKHALTKTNACHSAEDVGQTSVPSSVWHTWLVLLRRAKTC